MPIEFENTKDTSEWLKRYREPMDGSRWWFHHQISELPLAPGASQKYSETGEAKPIEGLSLITYIDHESELFQGLSREVQHLLTMYQDAGLEKYFAFLPEHTWHITIADITLTKDANLQHRLLEKVNASFSHAIQEQIPSAKMYFRSDVVVSAGISVVCLAEPGSEEDLKYVHTIRQLVTQELQPLGISMQDPQKFIVHMTVSYFVKKFDSESYSRFKNIMQESDAVTHSLGELSINQIELRRFTSMENWGDNPLSVLRLTK
jgi:hypothetical protein